MPSGTAPESLMCPLVFSDHLNYLNRLGVGLKQLSGAHVTVYIVE